MEVMKRAPFVALTFLAAAGCCSSAQRDRGRVQSEWSTTLRELAITPTFPPREDFFVGDLYVTPYDPNSPEVDAIFRKRWDDLDEGEKEIRNQIGMNVRLMSLDVRSALASEYATRPSAPSSGFSPDRLNDVPSIALSSLALASAVNDVKAKEAAIKLETDKVKAAQDAIAVATQTLATAKINQTRIDTDLADAIKRAGDLPSLRKAQDEARKAAAAAEGAVVAKQKEVDTAPDALAKKAREAELLLLIKDRDVANNQLAGADANVLNANTALTTIDAAGGLRTRADAARTTTRAAEDAFEAAKVAEQAKITAAQTKIETLNAELAPLKEKATAAKTQHDALVTAAKLLSLGQPSYANRNVFNGALLNPLSAPFQNPDSVTRLRLVAFPDFVTASFTGVDAAAMIPVEAVNLGVSVSSQDISGVSVKVPAAESYALPLVTLTPMVYAGQSGPRKLQVAITKALLQFYDPNDAAPRLTRGNRMAEDALFITVVGEVFYARALDVAISYKSTRGARLTASPTGTTQPAGAPIGATDTLASMIGGLQSRIGQTQVVPGGSIQIVSGSEFGVGLRRTFDRPVAIGYRGFTVRVKKSELAAAYAANNTAPQASADPPRLPIGPTPLKVNTIEKARKALRAAGQ